MPPHQNLLVNNSPKTENTLKNKGFVRQNGRKYLNIKKEPLFRWEQELMYYSLLF